MMTHQGLIWCAAKLYGRSWIMYLQAPPHDGGVHGANELELQTKELIKAYAIIINREL